VTNGDTTDTAREPSAERLVLGIETSCDETAAAVVARAPDGTGRILANVVRSQWDAHRAYGGVVPEIAARAHAECLDEIIRSALAEAGVGWGVLDAVAATAGPGLVGGLIVGLTTAKAIALVHGLPLVAVNHLEAHALTVGLTEGLRPPYLLLLVSGGHTQLIDVLDIGRYERLGTTIDDALGEAFDKTAKLLDLGFPGGPAVEAAARDGDERRFPLPRPMAGRAEPNFSFAGLKTAVRTAAAAIAPLTDRDVADIAAAFQATAAATVVDRVQRAMALCTARRAAPAHGHVLVVAGGVAANVRLRAALTTLTETHGWRLALPPIALCTDNAAMVAWAGAERLARDAHAAAPLDLAARARWPLDADAAPALGSGRLGAKA
jgi:N6-L-threonylcarbamoyladenine synthase